MRVFLSSPWIPAEWIKAHGLEPQVIWSAGDFCCHSPSAAGICAFAEGVLRFAETHLDSAIVFASACDQLRRAFDTACFRGCSRVFLFNLPATQTAAAEHLYRFEMGRLGKFLVQMGGSVPTPDILWDEMARADEIRRRLLEAVPVSHGNQIPLALAGGPVCMTHRRILEVIEAAGGRVILDGTENGERNFCPQLAPDGHGDPFEALITAYFNHLTDVFQRPNSRLYEWLKLRVLSRQVRGIVLWLFTGCDLWRAEAQTLRERFGLPVLLLEADDAAGISPRDVNRLQAFVEMLK